MITYLILGPALVYLSPDEKRILGIYLKHYRTLAADCDSPKYFVFPNRLNKLTQGCCSQISFSGLSKIIATTARKCHPESKVTSRILRRSQITVLWKDYPSGAWRMQVAAQCGHSLDTASRYYDYSEKVEPGKRVIVRLMSLRAAATDDRPMGPPGSQQDEQPASKQPEAEELPALEVMEAQSHSLQDDNTSSITSVGLE